MAVPSLHRAARVRVSVSAAVGSVLRGGRLWRQTAAPVPAASGRVRAIGRLPRPVRRARLSVRPASRRRGYAAGESPTPRARQPPVETAGPLTVLSGILGLSQPVTLQYLRQQGN